MKCYIGGHCLPLPTFFLKPLCQFIGSFIDSSFPTNTCATEFHGVYSKEKTDDKELIIPLICLNGYKRNIKYADCKIGYANLV